MPATNTPSRSRTTRIVLLVGAAIVALLALAAAGAGATAIWADLTQKDSHGYLSSAKHEYTTPSRAIATEDIDMGTDVPQWLFGKIRIEASSDKPVFVGIARSADVERYLARVDHAVLTNVDFDPFKTSYVRMRGWQAPAAPAKQTFWSASSVGTGLQTLTWPTQDGHWSVVVMNADGTPGVRTGVVAGAELPYAIWIGIGLAVFGVVLGAAAAAMIYAGTRGSGPPAVIAGQAPRTPAGPAPSAPAASS